MDEVLLVLIESAADDPERPIRRRCEAQLLAEFLEVVGADDKLLRRDRVAGRVVEIEVVSKAAHVFVKPVISVRIISVVRR